MDRVMRGVVTGRVEALQRLDVQSIAALPQKLREVVHSLGNIAITQYHDVTNEGGHVVVVQALRERWCGLFTSLEVDGFVVDKSGAKRPLTEPEKWPYI